MAVSIKQDILIELVRGILAVIPVGVHAIILYGSVARGTDERDSDVDIALVLDSPLTPEQEDRLADLVVELDLKYDRVFSVIDLAQSDLERYTDVIPFYRNVQKEGIVLWKAA